MNPSNEQDKKDKKPEIPRAPVKPMSQDEKLDEALEETFPASDPIAPG